MDIVLISIIITSIFAISVLISVKIKSDYEYILVKYTFITSVFTLILCILCNKPYYSIIVWICISYIWYRNYIKIKHFL